MKTDEVQVDQYGQITGCGIHDAVVQAFNFAIDDRFDICLRDASGKDRWMFLRDVALIGFKDLVNGTILSEVFCWKLDASSAKHIETSEAWRVLFGGNYVEGDLQSLVFKSQERYATQFLVFFESSYGGTIAAICREVRFDRT